MRKRPCFTARSNLKCGNSNSHLSLGRAGVYARAGSSYLRSLLYDKFEQRVFVEQGNGVKTAYSYDAKTRRLNSLTAQKNDGTLFQNLAYSYDKVGNILGLANNVAVPPPNVFGGPTSQSFAYDELYRLTHAEGTFQFSPSKSHTYTMDMVYDTIHNIALKNQLHTIIQPSQQAITQKKTSYNFAYAYNPSGANSIRPHAPTHIDLRTYTYDLDGNQTGWTHDTNGTRRTITWDEENRIQNVADNGQTKDYKYDDQGQRMIKRGPQGETVYVNQFYTQRPGATGTKHIYAGTSRIASKLVRQDKPNSTPSGNTPLEKDLYFVHPDHLGSSNYVTDLNGKLYEHLEYFPFGEAWVEENSNQQRTPFLFTAKELDEETGLYYFGARYYDPRTSVWQSGDPALEKYLKVPAPGNGSMNGRGIYLPANLALYSYAHQRPVILIDPDGERPLTQGEITLARSVFGESINYSKVDVYSNPFSKSESVTLGFANAILFADLKADMSKEVTSTRGHFIHEMAHIWQSQQGMWTTMRGIAMHVGATIKGFFKGLFSDKSISESIAAERQKLYDIMSGEAKPLGQYNMEQQATAVERNFTGRETQLTGGTISGKEARAREIMVKTPAFPGKEALE